MAFILADLNKEVDNGTVTHRGPHHDDGGATLDSDPSNTSIATFTGRGFDLCAPETWKTSFHMDDIAHALGTLSRFNGHVHFYSVAEHALRVSEYLRATGHDDMTQLLGLHHDDTEAYIGDIPRPQKKLMTVWDMPFEEYEHYMAVTHLFPWLDIEYTDERWAEVKKADYAVYLKERSERPKPATQSHAMVPGVATEMFLLRDERLRQDLTGE